MNYTYEDVIRLAISDFENFYEPKFRFSVNFQFENSREIAKISGNAERSVIIFDKFSTGEKISSLDDVLLCILIVGHELAHYVNRHMSHIDKNKKDSVAIESWADYFGARITFTILTYGESISNLVAALTSVPFAKAAPFAWRQDYILRAMGRSLLRAYETLYRPTDASGRYLKSPLRTCNFLAGVTSFFYRSMGELNENWLFYVYKRMGCDGYLADTIYDPNVEFVEQDHFNRTRKIHVGIQGKGKKFITKGVKGIYRNLISTDYTDDPRQRYKAKERIVSEFKEWKFKVEI